MSIDSDGINYVIMSVDLSVPDVVFGLALEAADVAVLVMDVLASTNALALALVIESLLVSARILRGVCQAIHG